MREIVDSIMPEVLWRLHAYYFPEGRRPKGK